jgi:hypothetical protein
MLRSNVSRRLASALAVAIAVTLLISACGQAATPTLAPVVITVYGQGTQPPQIGNPPTPVPPEPSQPTAVPATGDTPATEVPIIGPDVYPAGVSPLTGEAVGEARVNRLPIAAKISNFPYSVRPQSGLSLADLVFEHLAEAGLTRFTAVFLQNDAAKIGSIRSARYIDTEIAPMFGAMLVTSGSSLGTMSHLRRNAWFAGGNAWRLVSEESQYVCPPLCRETPDDANTLFASSEALWASTRAPAGDTHRALSGFVFTASEPAGGAPVSEVLVSYSSAAHVAWRYDAATRKYARWQETDANGSMGPHTDALTNAAITASNVVVLYVNHQNNFVPEDFRDGGNCGLEIQLWTIGPVRVFRDGKMIEGRWHRDPTTDWRLRLETEAGEPIALRPGNTWFSMVTLNAVPALNGATYSVSNRVPDTKANCPVPPTEEPTETPEGFEGEEAEATETPSP